MDRLYSNLRNPKTQGAVCYYSKRKKQTNLLLYLCSCSPVALKHFPVNSPKLTPLSHSLHFPTHSRQSAAMAAVKAISQTTSCLLSKTPFALKHKSHITNLCFGTKRVAFPSERLFSCRAIYNPQVQITEEGQPETLDYRVFFVNNSGKKVLFFLFSKKISILCVWVAGKCGKRKLFNGKTWNSTGFRVRL